MSVRPSPVVLNIGAAPPPPQPNRRLVAQLNPLIVQVRGPDRGRDAQNNPIQTFIDFRLTQVRALGAQGNDLGGYLDFSPAQLQAIAAGIQAAVRAHEESGRRINVVNNNEIRINFTVLGNDGTNARSHRCSRVALANIQANGRRSAETELAGFVAAHWSVASERYSTMLSALASEYDSGRRGGRQHRAGGQGVPGAGGAGGPEADGDSLNVDNGFPPPPPPSGSGGSAPRATTITPAAASSILPPQAAHSEFSAGVTGPNGRSYAYHQAPLTNDGTPRDVDSLNFDESDSDDEGVVRPLPADSTFIPVSAQTRVGGESLAAASSRHSCALKTKKAASKRRVPPSSNRTSGKYDGSPVLKPRPAPTATLTDEYGNPIVRDGDLS